MLLIETITFYRRLLLVIVLVHILANSIVPTLYRDGGGNDGIVVAAKKSGRGIFQRAKHAILSLLPGKKETFRVAVPMEWWISALEKRINPFRRRLGTAFQAASWSKELADRCVLSANSYVMRVRRVVHSQLEAVFDKGIRVLLEEHVLRKGVGCTKEGCRLLVEKDGQRAPVELIKANITQIGCKGELAKNNSRKLMLKVMCLSIPPFGDPTDVLFQLAEITRKSRWFFARSIRRILARNGRRLDAAPAYTPSLIPSGPPPYARKSCVMGPICEMMRRTAELMSRFGYPTTDALAFCGGRWVMARDRINRGALWVMERLMGGENAGDVVAAANGNEALTDYVPSMGAPYVQVPAPLWHRFDAHFHALAKVNRAVYVYSGPLYMSGECEPDPPPGQQFCYIAYKTLGACRIAVPTHLFKVALIETSAGTFEMEAYLLANASNLSVADDGADDAKSLSAFYARREHIERSAGFRLFKTLAWDQLTKLNGAAPTPPEPLKKRKARGAAAGAKNGDAKSAKGRTAN